MISIKKVFIGKQQHKMNLCIKCTNFTKQELYIKIKQEIERK